MTVRKKRRDPAVARALDEAFKLREAGRRNRALGLLEPFAGRSRNDGPVQTMLAMLAWEIDDTEKAIAYAERAISLSPKSKTASQILFHALWDAQRRDEAFSEMRRFLSHGESEIFRRLLSDLGKGLRDGKYDKRTERWLREWVKKMPLVRRTKR